MVCWWKFCLNLILETLSASSSNLRNFSVLIHNFEKSWKIDSIRIYYWRINNRLHRPILYIWLLKLNLFCFILYSSIHDMSQIIIQKAVYLLKSFRPLDQISRLWRLNACNNSFNLFLFAKFSFFYLKLLRLINLFLLY